MNVRSCLIWVLACGLLFGCGQKPANIDYVARVGDQYLTRTELTEMLSALHLGGDTAEAREQVIEQWVTNALLYEEALRRELSTDPAVQQVLREQRRSVLVNELTTRLYTENDRVPIPDADVQAYYKKNRSQLRLREPFVRILFFTTRSLARAETAQAALQATSEVRIPADWDSLASAYALNTSEARDLVARYYPEGQLFGATPPLRAQLQRLQPGETAPIFEIDSLYHVLHLVDRVAAGTIPEPSWVEPEIRRRLRLRLRKQMYAREVERLRNEALARDELDIR